MKVQRYQTTILSSAKLTLSIYRCTVCFFYTSHDFLLIRFLFDFILVSKMLTFVSSCSILERRLWMSVGGGWLVRLSSLRVEGREERGCGGEEVLCCVFLLLISIRFITFNKISLNYKKKEKKSNSRSMRKEHTKKIK